MKRFIICFILAISIMLGLCACLPTVVDQGEERVVFCGSFVSIKKQEIGNYIVYDKDTTVVYYLQYSSYEGHLSPYLIYKDGALYGAVFQDGEIVPVPYAYAPLE